uniref:Uncharacterized protein n=1 Tax=Setaria italica TaxID=4555 RepID=K3YF06_SETIT
MTNYSVQIEQAKNNNFEKPSQFGSLTSLGTTPLSIT